MCCNVIVLQCYHIIVLQFMVLQCHSVTMCRKALPLGQLSISTLVYVARCTATYCMLQIQQTLQWASSDCAQKGPGSLLPQESGRLCGWNRWAGLLPHHALPFYLFAIACVLCHLIIAGRLPSSLALPSALPLCPALLPCPSALHLCTAPLPCPSALPSAPPLCSAPLPCPCYPCSTPPEAVL